jgi:hypothetical protein
MYGTELYLVKPVDLHKPAALRSLTVNRIPVGDAGFYRVSNESGLLIPQEFGFAEPPMN